jgi:hypothetical protein
MLRKIKKQIREHFFRSLLIGVFVVVLIMVWVFLFGISSNLPGSHFNKNHNAIWIGHQWVGEEKSREEIKQMLKDLDSRGFDTVFVHAGPFKSDGNIDPYTYRFSIDFVNQAKEMYPEMEFQAWLGQLRGRIDLADTAVRKNMVNQATIMTQMVGFDGIHYDIEPVWDNDTDFIELLRQTREAIPKDKKMSVALAEFIPNSVIWFAKPVHEFKFYNTESNYENVAKYADQVVVMTYDTSLSDSRLYKWLVQEQTIWVTRLFKGSETEVFIAIPAYDEETAAFDPEVENIKTGIEGVVSGLNNIRSNEKNFAGIAIYPYWYIDQQEWEFYKQLWQN